MRRTRRIPLPLLVVLAAVLVESLAWTFAVPALQGADESSHFAYVQKIADAHTVPWTSRGDTYPSDFPWAVSTEQRTAWLWAGLEPLRGNRAARPLWTKTDEDIWRARDARLGPSARKDGDRNPAFRNPPLYYLTAVVPYEIARGSFFDRLYAVRLYNCLLLLATVALTWLLAGEVLGRRRELQTVAAAAVALQPVLLDVTTRVTPDGLLNALAAASLYLMALLVRRGWSWTRVGLLALAVTAAGFTQGRALALVLPAVVAVGVAAWRAWPAAAAAGGRARVRARAPRRGAAIALWAVAAVALLVAVGFYATRSQLGQVAGFWSYLWQFYLPRLPGMSPPVGPPWGVRDVFLDRFFGTFVQFEVGFPRDLLNALRDVLWIGLVLLAVAAGRHRRALRERRDVVVVLGLAFVLAMLSLHAAAFRYLLVNPADPVLTGRYLLMLIPLYGVAVAGALTALPGRVRAAATGAVLAGAVVLQVAALGEVVARFYA